MKKNINLITTIFFILCSILCSNITGKVGTEFLKLPSDAKGSALGETMVSASSDMYALYWNPAGLAKLSKNNIGISYNKWILDTYYLYTGGGLNLKKIGSLGLGVIFFSSGKIEGMEELNNYDLAIISGYGINFKSFNAGVSLKYIRKYIFEQTSEIFCSDLGLSKKFYKNKLNIGINIKNLEMFTSSQSLSSCIDLGFSYFNKASTDISFQFLSSLNIYIQNEKFFKFGFEIGIRDTIFFRFGYIFNIDELFTNAFQNWRFGLGGKILSLSVNISYMPYNIFGECIQTSIEFAF